MRVHLPKAQRAKLEVLRLQAGVLGNPCQHARAEFVAVVEGENEVGSTFAGQGAM
jgi:hypothetical protein